MYGGENFEGDNYDLDAAMSLSQLDFNDMQTAAQGIAVLRTSLTANNPTQALQNASASMNASSGNVTIVNANDNKSISSVSGDNVYQELASDHNEPSSGFFGFIKSIID